MTDYGLKPCPFCGDTDIKLRQKSELWNQQEIYVVAVFCQICSGQVESLKYPRRSESWEDAEREATMRWNARAHIAYPIYLKKNETLVPPFQGSI